MIFDNIKNELDVNRFEINYLDNSLPWGGSAVEAQKIAITSFETLSLACLIISDKIISNILIGAIGKRLFWQYHCCLSELCRVILGLALVKKSPNGEEGKIDFLNAGVAITLQKRDLTC